MIKDMFDPGESLVWEGKPDKTAYVAGPIFLYIIAGLLFMAALITIGVGIAADWYGMARVVCTFLTVLYLVPSLIIGVALPVWRSINWKYINYAITDRRIYIQKGIIGRDVIIKDYTDINAPEVSVDYIDKIRRCGSVHLSPRYYIARNGRKMYTLAPALLHIPDPYGVYDMVKKMALDIRSDIYYPNAYRPENNEGYDADNQSAGQNLQ